jgi:methylenetetrahydrofolate dehydrogenase (NADP+)/methenyltetrahydrofolate cyclohydrolase
MTILDGKSLKKEILEKLKEELQGLEWKPGLAVIQVGEDPASKVYVGQKSKMAAELGYKFEHIQLPSDVSEEELLQKIDEINADDTIDGLLVQMPVPKHINPRTVQNRISPLKDVDGLTDINMGRLAHNEEGLVPCTPKGIIELLDHYGIEIGGKNVTIVGRSDLVGKPLASLMTNRDATVTLCHSKTQNLKLKCLDADILVVATGKAKLIKEDFVKDGAVVIDVGIHRQEDGTYFGDVDHDSLGEKPSFITPVPGGVGPMTVASLAQNTYEAYKMLKKTR